MESRIISKMVDAMHIGADDVVLLNLWCEELNQDLTVFENVLSEKGVKYHSIVFSDENLLNLTKENKGGLSSDWFSEYEDTTLVIDVMDKPAGMPPKGMDRADYPVFGAILQNLFGFMSRFEKLIQITMPSRINADLAGEEFEVYEKNIIKALDVDYDKLYKECKEKVESIKSDKLTIKTGESCELSMDLTGREWNIDAGEGAFPCGEVYIAPLEDKTNGNIYFKKFVLEGVGVFDDIIITVKDGKVTGSNCEEFNGFLAEQEEGANVVAELGIGMNPSVTFTASGASLDEDAIGTFHIGLGMNVMFGGTNNCRFHMDFVTEGEILGSN
jgi:hypothetical protein